MEMRKSVATVSVALLLTCLAGVTHAVVQLPLPTSFYYTAVSAGFGNLHFSLHYEEYGNATAQLIRTTGRYYSPKTLEWINTDQNSYAMDPEQNYNDCKTYPLSSVASGRLTQGSTSLLVSLSAANVPFQNLGLANPQLRGQSSVRFSATKTWSAGNAGTFSALDTFLLQAYATAGVPTSSSYSVQATIDVYYVSDSRGTLATAGDGNIPLQFVISGNRVDSIYGSLQLNIEYDFLNFANLNFGSNYQVYNVMEEIFSPNWCPNAATGSLPPALPAAIVTLPGVNTTLPIWDGGRAILELTASNANTQQIDAQLRPQHGEEMLVYLADANAYNWYTLLYAYDFPSVQSASFSGGSVYTLNFTDSRYYNEYFDNYKSYAQTCTGTTIKPSTVSPLQYLNADTLLTFFKNTASFLSGAVSAGLTGRTTIRGIIVDKWTITKSLLYNSVAYNYTVSLYVTANGWANLGRTTTGLAPQIIRIGYSGIRNPTRGAATVYSTAIDFFLQYHVDWLPDAINLDPQDKYQCPIISDGVSMMPTLPPQYTVSVSETWIDDFYSTQYTMYVDTTNNRRRIDGLFTGVNVSTVFTPSPAGPDWLTITEWSTNATLSPGFSAQTLSHSLPYTLYSPGQASSCGTAPVRKSDFAQSAAVSFFDWLALADFTKATYISSRTIRGMAVDLYEVSMNNPNGGIFGYGNGPNSRITSFMIAFLASDGTNPPNIPVFANVAFSNYFYEPFYQYEGYAKVVYQFYNFRSSLPKGIFNVPPPSSCTGFPQLPTTVANQNYYIEPDPTLDGTPMTATVWPNQFAVLIEGPLFAASNDPTIYTARWYTDFANYRERLDIEPAFNVQGSPRVTAVTGTYVYYYNQKPGNTFSFTDGVSVFYNSATCSASPITTANMNPLKQVAPGNLFDTFFPGTSQAISSQSSYNMQGRLWGQHMDGILYDEYNWPINSQFNGQIYTGTASIYISIVEWMNNALAGNFSNSRIPLSLQMTGTITSKDGTKTPYNPQFRTSFYQAGNPGVAFFDASLFGCTTSPTSPWYNIYGAQINPSDSSSTSSSGLIAGVVIAAVVVVLIASVVGYRLWKKSHPEGLAKFLKYGGGTSRARSNGEGHNKDNEMIGAAKQLTDNEPEHSLNRASLNHTVEVDENGVVIHDTNTATQP